MKHQIIQSILQDAFEAQRDATTDYSIARAEWFRKGLPEGEEPDFEAYWEQCIKIEQDAASAVLESGK